MSNQHSPPPAGFNVPTNNPGSASVIMVQAGSGVAGVLPKEQTVVTCPTCQQRIKTNVDYKTTSKTHCWACVLCCCLCWPCAWMPYCMASCKQANHTCPNCNTYIGASIV